MKHCVDGVAQLMLKRVSFFISVAGFKKNSNGYAEKNRELTRVNEILQTRISFFRFQVWASQELEYEFVDVYASRCGVEPMCRVLKTVFKDGFTTARVYYLSKSLVVVCYEVLAWDIQEISGRQVRESLWVSHSVCSTRQPRMVTHWFKTKSLLLCAS